MAQSAIAFPRSSTHLAPIGAALTKLVNAYNLAPENDIIVKLIAPKDLPDWTERPIAWRNNTGDIVINYGHMTDLTANLIGAFDANQGSGFARLFKADRNTRTLDYTKAAITEITTNITTAANNASSRPYAPRNTNGTINTAPLGQVHRQARNANMLGSSDGWLSRHATDERQRVLGIVGGILVRECTALLISNPVLDSRWFSDKTTGYEKNIIRVLEELRIERNQPLHIDQGLEKKYWGTTPDDHIIHSRWRTQLAIYAGLTAPLKTVVEEMTRKDDKGEISVPRFALMSSFILGRTHSHIYPEYSVKTIGEYVESIVGSDRLATMHRIWSEYVKIVDGTEAIIMPLIKQWEDMFKSDDEGSSTDNAIANPDSAGEPSEGDGSAGAGAGEGESQGQGSGEGSEDGEGNGQGQGQGQDGEGDGDPSSQDGESEGDGDGETPAEKGNTGLQDGSATHDAQASNADAGKGQRGGHTQTFGGKNTKGKNDDNLPPGDNEERLRVNGMDDYLKSLTELAAKEIDNVNTGDTDFTHRDPRHPTPSEESYDKATHRHEAKTNDERAEALADGRELEPTPGDRAAAEALGRTLAQLNVRDRGKFTTTNRTPPGRLRSRAAVQQKAERALNLPAIAEPWHRTRHTVNLNPPITVGIATDISGSMGWAEQLSARLAWIIQHAGSRVNARAAAVAFGNGATVTLRPTEKALERAQVIPANGSGEEFDMAMGTLDVMLNLVKGTGVRMLFVITDGNFVFENMMPRAAAWVENLTRHGVTVIWVSHETRHMHGGYPTIPEGAVHVDAEVLARAGGSYHYSGRDGGRSEVEAATRQVIDDLGNRLTTAIRAAKYGI